MSSFKDGLRLQLGRYFREKRYLFMFTIFFVMTWLAMDVYHHMIVASLPVAVLDLDNSKLSRTLRLFLSATREIAVVNDGVESLEQAHALLESGELGGFVLIPENFSADIKRGKKSSVSVLIDDSNILIGKNVYKAVAKAIGTVSAGVELTMVKKMGERKDRAMAKVVPIAIEENFTFNPGVNYPTYIVPGIIFFFLHVLMLILTFSAIIPDRRPEGFPAQAGAVAAGYLVCLVTGLIFFYGFLARVQIIPSGGFLTVFLALAVFLLMDILMAMAIVSVAPSFQTGFQLTIILGMLSLMFSGITWPSDTFPAILLAISKIIPFTPFARGYQVFLHYGVRFHEVGWMYGWFALQALLFGAMIAGGYFVRKRLAVLRGGAE